jgi:hypothetical protein
VDERVRPTLVPTRRRMSIGTCPVHKKKKPLPESGPDALKKLNDVINLEVVLRLKSIRTGYP